MSLSFSQVSFVLAFAAGIPSEKVETFQSRLKQWQKMGFPVGVNVGRGVKAKYGRTQLYQLAVMLRLMKLGLTPERAIEVVQEGWVKFDLAIRHSTAAMAGDQSLLIYALIRIDALSDLTRPGSSGNHVDVTWAYGDTIAHLLMRPDVSWPDDHRAMYTLAADRLRDFLAMSLIIELNSMLALLWRAVIECGVDLTFLQEERDTYDKVNSDDVKDAIIFPFMEENDIYADKSWALRFPDFNVQETARGILDLEPSHGGN